MSTSPFTSTHGSASLKDLKVLEEHLYTNKGSDFIPPFEFLEMKRDIIKASLGKDAAEHVWNSMVADFFLAGLRRLTPVKSRKEAYFTEPGMRDKGGYGTYLPYEDLARVFRFDCEERADFFDEDSFEGIFILPQGVTEISIENGFTTDKWEERVSTYSKAPTLESLIKDLENGGFPVEAKALYEYLLDVRASQAKENL